MSKNNLKKIVGKNITIYILTIIIFFLAFWLVVEKGNILDSAKFNTNYQTIKNISPKGFSIQESLINYSHPLAILLLQILAIILVARAFNWIMTKIKQPTVIGEIIAGIVLGPSILGLFYPEIFGFLFSKASQVNLNFLSQIGLILFMFIVGMELDLNALKNKGKDAIVISQMGIVFPFLLGMLLSYYIYVEFAPPHINFLSFALFIGISMSITAFPVLARIVLEKNMNKTPLGSLALTCAAADDITAWCMLAAVIAIVKAGTIFSALFTIAIAAVFLLFMFYVIKPILNKFAERYFNIETINKPIIAIIFSILIFSAFVTETIGIHALFGAFIAGVIIPANTTFRRVLSQKIEDVSLVLLLPLFFVYTGLKTNVTLLNNSHDINVFLVILAVAITGKFVGITFTSKLIGQNWKDSLLLGSLMNTRGLMELIVLNIGYDLGILNGKIFAMLVLMALVTTFMTGPAIEIIKYYFNNKEKRKAIISGIFDFNVLISFGSPLSGSRLLQLVYNLNLGNSHKLNVTALHLTPSADISVSEANRFERKGFEDILKTADELKIDIQTQYTPTNEVSREIVSYANNNYFNLMIVGSSRQMFSDDETGGRIKYFFEDTNCSVGVLIDKGFEKIERALFLIRKEEDKFLAEIARKFLNNKNKSIVLCDNFNILSNDTSLWGINKDGNKNISRIENPYLDEDFYSRFDIIIVSLANWKLAKHEKAQWVNFNTSVLIIKE